MRRGLWPRGALLLLLFATLAACELLRRPEVETVATPTTAGVAIAATALPALTPTPVPLPTLIPRPSVTPQRGALPEGWKEAGGETIGLQMAVPGAWIDFDALLESAGVTKDLRLGPHSLWLVDSEETGNKLLAGESIGQGAFAVSFVTGLSTSALSLESAVTSGNGTSGMPADPVARLRNILEEKAEASSLLSAVMLTTVNDVPAAYVDLNRDPFAMVPDYNHELRVRLLLFIVPESEVPVVFLLATSLEAWKTYKDTFAQMIDTITIYNVDYVKLVGELNSGDLVEGQLSRGVTDVWTFAAEGGRYAAIELTPGERSIDLTLTLIDPSGRTVASVDNGSANEPEELLDVVLSESGLYLIEVSEFFNESGRYNLSLLLADRPQFGGGGRIEMGQEISAELSPNGEHTWSFAGSAGQSVTIIVTPLAQQLDVILELLGPEGQSLKQLDEGFSGDAEVLVGFELLVTGQYTIRIRGFAGHGGAYALSLDEGGEMTANFYEAGDIVYGGVKRDWLRANEAHAWFFNGRAGDEIILVVTPLEPRMDVDLWLLDPAVKVLVMMDENLSGEKETIEYTLPVDGQYLALVREFFGEPGQYEITLRAGGSNFLEQAGELSYGQTVSGSLIPGKRAVWAFAGQRGEVIHVELLPLHEEGDLVLVLQRPDGSTAVIVDDHLSGAGETLYAFTLTADGQWQIIVQEFFDDGGEYQLTLTRN